MQTEIKIKTSVQQTTTIEIPAYFKSGDYYYRLTADKNGDAVMDKLYRYPETKSHDEEYGFIPTTFVEDISDLTPITAKEYFDVLGDMVFYLRVMRDTIIPDSEFPPAPENENGGC